MSEPIQRAATAVPDVYLHVGARRAGASLLQRLLTSQAEKLRSDGVLFPADNGRRDQVWAARDVLGHAPGPAPVSRYEGSWERLRSQLLEFDGRAALVSTDLLGMATPDQAAEVVAALAPAKVHVVLTLRDASQVLPEAWKTWTQNRGTASWSDYVDTARERPDADSPAGRAYRRALDVEGIIQAWAPTVPTGRLHVVTVPPSAADGSVLWERFAVVVGLDPHAYSLPAEGAEGEYDYAAADLMWRVNGELEEIGGDAYEQIVRQRLCRETLAVRDASRAVPIPPEVVELARGLADRVTHLVNEAGADVVGDLAELAPAEDVRTTAIPPSSPRDLLAVAEDALTGLERVVDDQRERRRRLARAVGIAEPHPDRPGADEDEDGLDTDDEEPTTTVDDLDPHDPDSIEAAVERVVDQVYLAVGVWQQAERLRRRRERETTTAEEPLAAGPAAPRPWWSRLVRRMRR